MPKKYTLELTDEFDDLLEEMKLRLGVEAKSEVLRWSVALVKCIIDVIDRAPEGYACLSVLVKGREGETISETEITDIDGPVPYKKSG